MSKLIISLSTPICRSAQVPELGKFALTVIYQGVKRDALLLRFKGVVYGYLNQCVHMPKALDCEASQIFDDSGRYIQCSMHSICYDPVTGASVSALCEGKKLKAFKVTETEEWVYLVDKKTQLAV
ncbi:Rieske 2Fe-2S domain-containing protein [Methylomonas sp. AM2-LC]|uniref:Rieske (2Fe-2S) protein n=1 Tax=Methylomonas sp. AM2-LC TaxID=3153301 RepID=UPI003265A403